MELGKVKLKRDNKILKLNAINKNIHEGDNQLLEIVRCLLGYFTKNIFNTIIFETNK